jgi:hypothetical protein
MKKVVLISLIFLVIIIAFAGCLGVATLKFAVYNDCENYITDVNITVKGEVVNHITIDRGYWADFGMTHVPAGVDIPIKIQVDYYDAKTKEYVKSEVWERTDSFIDSIYGAGFVINETGIWIVEYPNENELKEPMPVEIKSKLTS